MHLKGIIKTNLSTGIRLKTGDSVRLTSTYYPSPNTDHSFLFHRSKVSCDYKVINRLALFSQLPQLNVEV